MNRLAVDALVDAQLRGVRQIKYALYDYLGGMCAGGVLITALGERWNIESIAGMRQCVECPHNCGYPEVDEWSIMVHMNNYHNSSFLEIARKLEHVEPSV